MSTTLYTRLMELLPSQPVLTATVSTVYLDETALVTMPGGAQARVRNPLAAGQGDAVYVQDGAVIGQAPALPVVVIEI